MYMYSTLYYTCKVCMYVYYMYWVVLFTTVTEAYLTRGGLQAPSKATTP